MINHFKIKKVFQGQATELYACRDGGHPYGLAKDQGLFEFINSNCKILPCVPRA